MINKFLMIMMFAFSAFNAQSQVANIKCKTNETKDPTYKNLCVESRDIPLVENSIKIKIYTKETVSHPRSRFDRTFVVVHANEEKALDAAKQVISANYGRLVEVVSRKDGENQRFLYFGEGKCIDPNRIYTKKGIKTNLKAANNPCRSTNPDEDSGDKIYKFGVALLSLVTKNNTHSFIIGVHNNDNTLSVSDWINDGEDAKSGYGVFKDNNHTHDINSEMLDTDSHNFALVTNPNLFIKLFTDGVYSVALQEDRRYLTEPVSGTSKRALKADLDDGSMSIYFGATLFGTSGKPFDYIIIEAGGKDNPNEGTIDRNKEWQKKVIKFVLDMKR